MAPKHANWRQLAPKKAPFQNQCIARDIAGRRAYAAEGRANVYCSEPVGTDVHQGSEFTSYGGTFSRPGMRVPACTASTFLGRGQDGFPRPQGSFDRGKPMFLFSSASTGELDDLSLIHI